MTIRLDLSSRITGSFPSSTKGSGAKPDGDMAKTSPYPSSLNVARPNPFRRVQVQPPHVIYPEHKSSRAERSTRFTGQTPPTGTRDKIHFVLFVSMCVIGAVVFIDTGPFPFNFIFGAFAIILPIALVAKRRRSSKNKSL